MQLQQLLLVHRPPWDSKLLDVRLSLTHTQLLSIACKSIKLINCHTLTSLPSVLRTDELEHSFPGPAVGVGLFATTIRRRQRQHH